MDINQGDIFWVELDEPGGSEPVFRRPFVVVQNNLFNQSRINTVVVCALTTNLKRALAPGNILLENGEANIPIQSVINVSQIYTLDKNLLVEQIGKLSQKRIHQCVEGIRLLISPTEVD
jgi:mRNA interferase MazF